MKKRLYLYMILTMFAGLSVFFCVSLYTAYSNDLNIAKSEVVEIAGIYAGFYEKNEKNSGMTDEDFVKIGAKIGKPNASNRTRITLVSQDGTVLADSRPVDAAAMENHLDRPEIQAALNGEPQIIVRRSETFDSNLVYYAVKVEINDGYVFVRTSIPIDEANEYFFDKLPLLIAILVALSLLSFFLIRRITDKITTPFSSIEQRLRDIVGNGYTLSVSAAPETPVFEKNYEKDFKDFKGYEEINSIVRVIDNMASILKQSFDSLKDEKSKINYILDNIGEGIFSVDKNGNITLINKSALEIFDVTPDVINKGIIYLFIDDKLTNAVKICVETKKSSSFETVIDGKIFLVTVKRLPDDDLTIAVLSDVTENRENAKRREEFFTNASHELKTPLTAIKGFNELSQIHNKDEKIGKFLGSITREIDRMLFLIGDMLKLSELENSDKQGKLSKVLTVSLNSVIDEVASTMSTAISEKSITFETSGEGSVTAEQGHIYDLVKNLIENAVRYNNKGGKVSVTVETFPRAKNTMVKLTVSDNGIGIPQEDQSRIFERFYRVEKSRSEENGGTGLGLSIVKHVCALYDWKISLKSKAGVGTEVAVFFE